jgi:DNA-binding response OmpR family regulator
MNERILIIEDDQQILKLLQRGLAYEGLYRGYCNGRAHGV